MAPLLGYTLSQGTVLRPSWGQKVARGPTLQLSVQAVPFSHTSRIASNPALLPVAALSILNVPPYGDPKSGAKKGGKVLVWFRSDLRLHDHPALNHALEEGATVVPVYCFDPRCFGKTQFGFEKTGTGRYRAKFLIESVEALRKALQAKGSDLVVRVGRPEDVLPEICRRVGASTVMFHREVSYEDKQVEVAVERALKQKKVEHSAFWANTLYHEEDLPFRIDDMPDVYTHFREALQSKGKLRAPLAPPGDMSKFPRIDVGKVPKLSDLGLTEPNPEAHGMHKFKGGEEEALRRLDLYVSESRRVPDGRSAAVHLHADFSCKISPWLALGCISPRRIYNDLTAKAAKAGQTTTYFELVWRDFFRCITEKYNRTKVGSGARSVTEFGAPIAACAH